ncbi:MAG: hypothetical protein CVV64_16595 [Candidatus Wallbacteria bacterium HGW-Wallbacteria-1]|jgi:hypothetical protein|uniref:Uncharacterized protein n=1 Tax=Candidatus Wallbacteria bacterium HGW-Wallbacteria-1 TaxID=2013854 RepID=A0A2N1PKR9_9BACT|nr:MAG: hypothetical protein CVV64_16595 [Candidatus Wallbacteria bacterium HGW-Wallbacteria-1]
MTSNPTPPSNYVSRITELFPEAASLPMSFEPNAGYGTDAIRMGDKYIALFPTRDQKFSPRFTLDLCDLIREHITLPLPSEEMR